MQRNKSARGIRYLAVLIVVISSCTKDSLPFIDQYRMYKCDDIVLKDSILVSKVLIGKWECRYASCPWISNPADKVDYRGLSMYFNEDHTLHYKQNNITLDTSSWNLILDKNKDYKLKIGHEQSQFGVIITLCNDVLEFYNSFVDGCDFYYKKKR